MVLIIVGSVTSARPLRRALCNVSQVSAYLPSCTIHQSCSSATQETVVQTHWHSHDLTPQAVLCLVTRNG